MYTGSGDYRDDTPGEPLPSRVALATDDFCLVCIRRAQHRQSTSSEVGLRLSSTPSRLRLRSGRSVLDIGHSGGHGGRRSAFGNGKRFDDGTVQRPSTRAATADGEGLPW
jgi:hypothetical protein